MVIETTGKQKVLINLHEAVTELQALIMSLQDDLINKIPFKDSWTPGQLINHVFKSLTGMAHTLSLKGRPAERDAGERIPELKKIFLDFSHKMKSPEFIEPESGPFEKNALRNDLDNAYEMLQKNTGNANPDDMVDGLPLGPITKGEILYFALYHTQRHLHQLQKICEALFQP